MKIRHSYVALVRAVLVKGNDSVSAIKSSNVTFCGLFQTYDIVPIPSMSFNRSNAEAVLESHRFLPFLRSLFVVPTAVERHPSRLCRLCGKRVATRSDMRLCTGLRKNFKIKIETMDSIEGGWNRLE